MTARAPEDTPAAQAGHGRRGLPGRPGAARAVGRLSTRRPVFAEGDTSGSFAAQLRTVSDRPAAVPTDGAGSGSLAHLGDDETRAVLAALLGRIRGGSLR
ncbi:hypothetical protein MUU72_15575 [Streptomyces sp. RS10V-4]|uniref:hypothetical protein n=1 Tax=Streptomyces rhizoryzae TaxID=2932493 RepID=UPI002004F60A|nr:hypothetical protein [Streptomyces rhizoryzae]MCK7624504.1 hypothetical protein [Streptomyces rhizoryzae]